MFYSLQLLKSKLSNLNYKIGYWWLSGYKFKSVWVGPLGCCDTYESTQKFYHCGLLAQGSLTWAEPISSNVYYVKTFTKVKMQQLCIKNTFGINIFYNAKLCEPYNCSYFILSRTRLKIRERYYINGIPLYFNASAAEKLWIRPLKWSLGRL